MKHILIALAAIFLVACTTNDDNYHKPENALDAGREFIQHSLKGHFNTAEKYMLADAENKYWLNKWSEDFNKNSEEEKTGYSKASINIIEVKDLVPDSLTVINYSNSYRNRPQEIKVIKYNGEWKVDFKYTFAGEPQ